MSALLELAERCEQATEGQMSGLIWEAGGAIFGTDEPSDSHSRHAWFVAHAQAEAWLDAAMTLVPEGWRVRDFGDWEDRWLITLMNEDTCAEVHSRSGRGLPALALCAAALRAKAAAQ